MKHPSRDDEGVGLAAVGVCVLVLAGCSAEPDEPPPAAVALVTVDPRLAASDALLADLFD